MKKMMSLLCAASLLGSVTGCKSSALKTTTYGADGSTVVTEPVANSLMELGKAYYAQPNAAKIIEIEGTNLTFSVTGATRFCLSTPVPAKQIMPRETSWYDGLADALKTAAPWIFMAYWVHEGGFGSSSSTSSTTTTTNNN